MGFTVNAARSVPDLHCLCGHCGVLLKIFDKPSIATEKSFCNSKGFHSRGKQCLRNTARAKNLIAESGKFFAEAPDIPDEKIAQYAILFEHPDRVTSSEEHPGWYWLSHKKE